MIEGGRAAGVVANGKVIRARRTILASVAPQALYGGLLPASVVPTALRAGAHSYRAGRAGMQIHVALSAPLTRTDQRLADVPLLHISVPAGAGALWIQLQQVPFRPSGDAAGRLQAEGEWSTELARDYSARVLERIAAHAPDLHSKVVAVDVVTPTDLASYNPNAIGGDPYGGSAELDQTFLWRPFLAGASHRTVVPGLWHLGASTYPGPGIERGNLTSGEGPPSRPSRRIPRDREADRRTSTQPGRTTDIAQPATCTREREAERNSCEQTSNGPQPPSHQHLRESCRQAGRDGQQCHRLDRLLKRTTRVRR